jgi:hypothetical protein
MRRAFPHVNVHTPQRPAAGAVLGRQGTTYAWAASPEGLRRSCERLHGTIIPQDRGFCQGTRGNACMYSLLPVPSRCQYQHSGTAPSVCGAAGCARWAPLPARALLPSWPSGIDEPDAPSLRPLAAGQDKASVRMATREERAVRPGLSAIPVLLARGMLGRRYSRQRTMLDLAQGPPAEDLRTTWSTVAWTSLRSEPPGARRTG